MLRDGDKQHIAKALEDSGQFLGGIDKGQAYDFLNFYLNSSMSNKDLQSIYGKLEVPRPKNNWRASYTKEAREYPTLKSTRKSLFKRLYLRVQLSTYPFRAYKPTIVFRNTNGSIVAIANIR